MTEIPAGNYLTEGQKYHGELLDKATRTIWQSSEPLTPEGTEYVPVITASLGRDGLLQGESRATDGTPLPIG